MKTILVTQRVEVAGSYCERRDALDQAWPRFLTACELTPILVPNHPAGLERWLAGIAFDGVLLTGGNDLLKHGGDAPERDEVEHALLKRAVGARIPVLGVCRGMQVLLDAFGTDQQRVEGHVQPHQQIVIDGVAAAVNSYHEWGCHEVGAGWEVWARADDGVVKAVRHDDLPLVGVMWHPERLDPFRAKDRELFRAVFTSHPDQAGEDPE